MWPFDYFEKKRLKKELEARKQRLDDMVNAMRPSRNRPRSSSYNTTSSNDTPPPMPVHQHYYDTAPHPPAGREYSSQDHSTCYSSSSDSSSSYSSSYDSGSSSCSSSD